MGESVRTYLRAKRVVQVAGIVDEPEARMLTECGVDLLGFALAGGQAEGEITPRAAGDIIRSLRPPAYGTLVTYEGSCGALVALCRSLGASILQLHGGTFPDEIRRLKEALPALFVVKTLVVRGDNVSELMDDVDRFGPYVDGFLTDTYDDETGRWGATGKTHDWSISRRIVEKSSHPVILAGGLTPENVRRAILEVGPAGVDVHTGVEDHRGRKDRRLVEKFVDESRRAFASI